MKLNASFYAARFRELADRLEHPQANTEAGAAFEDFEIRTAAGQYLIDAVGRGFLRDLAGLRQLVDRYANPPARDPAAQATWCWAPANLFLEFAGRALVTVTASDDGSLSAVGDVLAGVLPAATGQIATASFQTAGANASDPQARRDFFQLAEASQNHRYVIACRILAGALDAENAAAGGRGAKTESTIAVLLGEFGAEVSRIIASDKTLSEKCKALVQADRRFLDFDSTQWNALLRCSNVRTTRWWREDRPRLIADEKADRRRQ